MRNLFRAIARLARDDRFTEFQHEVVRNFYDTLGQGYATSDNEVGLVKRLVAAADGKSYGPIRLHASMLHGTRSYVEFNYMDRPVTKELGDMAIIELVTAGRNRLFQRLCVVQNKKTDGESWGIDPEQLFMLKNFPPFSGHKGIFRGRRDVVFRNASGCLGAFGLFASPGEMLFSAAPLISEFSRGKKSVSLSDISSPMASGSGRSATGAIGLPFWAMSSPRHPKELSYLFEEYFGLHPHEMAQFSGLGTANYLGNIVFSRDLYDLVRAWTQISIGEPTYVYDTIVNASVDAFTNLLIRSAGFGELADFPGDEIFGDHRFEGQMAVLLAHLEVEGQG